MLSTKLLNQHNNVVKNISTLPRYVFLNFYAFLLLFLGIGIVFLFMWNKLFWFLVEIPISVFCLYVSVQIFSSWSDKKRQYVILMERNKVSFRPDTFYEYMQAPCGRLLVKIVLKDLGLSHNYKQLKYQQKFCWRMSCDNTKARIFINSDYKE